MQRYENAIYEVKKGMRRRYL